MANDAFELIKELSRNNEIIPVFNVSMRLKMK
jgi:hypothetical protein